jgi:hypothetical protein
MGRITGSRERLRWEGILRRNKCCLWIGWGLPAVYMEPTVLGQDYS